MNEMNISKFNIIESFNGSNGKMLIYIFYVFIVFLIPLICYLIYQKFRKNKRVVEKEVGKPDTLYLAEKIDPDAFKQKLMDIYIFNLNQKTQKTILALKDLCRQLNQMKHDEQIIIDCLNKIFKEFDKLLTEDISEESPLSKYDETIGKYRATLDKIFKFLLEEQSEYNSQLVKSSLAKDNTQINTKTDLPELLDDSDSLKKINESLILVITKLENELLSYLRSGEVLSNLLQQT